MNDKNNCQHKKMSLGACMLKRIFDVICSLGGLIVTSPAFLLNRSVSDMEACRSRCISFAQ